MVGVLFLRTYERAENVYLTMSSRGFDGKIYTIDNFSFKLRDFYFLITVTGLLFFIRFLAA